MSNLIELPGNHKRTWRLLELEYRQILRSGGVDEGHVKPILDEMAGYFLELATDIKTTFSLPGDLGFNTEQTDAVLAEFERSSSDTRAQLTKPFMGALAIILALLVQKHQAG